MDAIILCCMGLAFAEFVYLVGYRKAYLARRTRLRLCVYVVWPMFVAAVFFVLGILSLL
jgi:hypothetical protein